MASDTAVHDVTRGRSTTRNGTVLLLVAVVATVAALVASDGDPTECPDGTTLVTSTGDPGNRLGPDIERACVDNHWQRPGDGVRARSRTGSGPRLRQGTRGR